jgi:hypothetical protein
MSREFLMLLDTQATFSAAITDNRSTLPHAIYPPLAEPRARGARGFDLAAVALISGVAITAAARLGHGRVPARIALQL